MAGRKGKYTGSKKRRSSRKRTYTRRKRGRPKKYTNLDSFSERSIQYFLHNYYKEASTYLCRNKYLYTWECDFWHINRTGYHVENEIKVSRSDWNKEFKDKPVKHEFLMETLESGGENLNEEEGIFCPNKFVMTCPENLIQPEEVKELMPFASLSWITNTGAVKTKINKFIHKRKMDMTRVLLRKFYSTCVSLEYNIYMALKKYNEKDGELTKAELDDLLKEIFKETRI